MQCETVYFVEVCHGQLSVRSNRPYHGEIDAGTAARFAHVGSMRDGEGVAGRTRRGPCTQASQVHVRQRGAPIALS